MKSGKDVLPHHEEMSNFGMVLGESKSHALKGKYTFALKDKDMIGSIIGDIVGSI